MVRSSSPFKIQSHMSNTHKQSPTTNISCCKHHRHNCSPSSETSMSDMSSPWSNLSEDPLAEFSPIFSMSPFASSDLDILSDARIFPFQQDKTGFSQSPDHMTFPGSWVDSILYSPAHSSPSTYSRAPAKPDEDHDEDKTTTPNCRHRCRLQGKSEGEFECKWKNCQNPGPFTRKAVLMRHIDTQHISPRSFNCPDEQCGKSFNRKDNLDEHFRRVHWD